MVAFFAHALLVATVAVFVSGCDVRSLNQSKGGEGDDAEKTLSKTGGDKQSEEKLSAGGGGADGERFASMLPEEKDVGNIFTYTRDGYLDVKHTELSKSGEGSGLWAYHHPTEGVEDSTGESLGFLQHFTVVDEGVYLWTRIPTSGDDMRVVCYYTVDGSDPEGVRGVPSGTTLIADFSWAHNSPNAQGGVDDWWRVGPISGVQKGIDLSYKIGVFREKK